MKNLTLPGALLATVLAASPARADFTVTGVFRYRDRPFTYYAGFTGATPSLPIRQAVVQVQDDATGQILASGVTDDAGFVAIQVTGAGTLDVVVRCQAQSRLYGNGRVRVTDTSGNLYSVSSAVFPAWDLDLDLAVGTITAEKIHSDLYQGNPFDMLDMGLWAVEYVLSLGAGNPTGNIVLRWPGGGGSFASGFTVTLADDDGYDDVVMLHELGHVVHAMYSDSDNPGGYHSFGDSDQNPLLSYGEGWATFFAGAVRQSKGILDPGFYLDASGTSSGSVKLRARLENAAPFAGSSAGEANELAVAGVLWDVVDTASTNDGNAIDDDALDGSVTFAGGLDGDRMLWSTFVGPVAQASSLTIRDHWNAFFDPVDFGLYARLAFVFGAFEIRNFADAEEPNDSAAQATPVAGDGAWLPIRTLYHAQGPAPAPGDGDADFYALDLAVGDPFEAATRYPNGAPDVRTYADPKLVVRRPDGTVFATHENISLTDRNARLTALADAAGTWTIAVTTDHGYRKTGSYQVRIARGGFGVASVSPPSFPALAATPQTLTVNGFGLTKVQGITLDGIPLAPLASGIGNYVVVDDGRIDIVDVPPLTRVGPVELELEDGLTSVKTKVVVTEVSPLIVTSSAVTNQTAGIDLRVGAKLGDWIWVWASTAESPTAFPGLATLGIGGQNAPLVTPWKALISLPGHAGRHFGPLEDLAGTTVFWQGFVLEAGNDYDPPWPTTNVVSTFVAF